MRYSVKIFLLIFCIWTMANYAAGAVPTANFSGSPTSGPPNLDVTFMDTSTGSPTGWAWFFGDEKFTETWTQQTANASWSYRADHSSSVLPDGSIVLLGGLDYNEAYNDTWRSTDKGISWTRMTANAGWSARYNHCSVVLPDGSILILGGQEQSPPQPINEGYKNDTWRSTDKGATWTRMTTSAGWSARSAANSVVLSDGSIVVMGGWDNVEEKNDVWRSTDKGVTWSQMTANASWSKRVGFSSVVLPDDSIVIMGGTSGGEPKKDVWLSTDKGATWTEMTRNAAWSFRWCHSSVVLPDGSIILTGGLGVSSDYNDVWRSADKGATWTLLTVNADWSARWLHNTVVLPDGSILLIGGQAGGAYKKEVWRFSPVGSVEKNPSHSYSQLGAYQVALQVYNGEGYHSIQKNGYINVAKDITPPATVTNLINITYQPNYINWTWNDPQDSDFEKVMVYLNGTWMANVTKGTKYYNATGLLSNTQYIIGIKTADTHGNVNQTLVLNITNTSKIGNIPHYYIYFGLQKVGSQPLLTFPVGTGDKEWIIQNIQTDSDVITIKSPFPIDVQPYQIINIPFTINTEKYTGYVNTSTRLTFLSNNPSPGYIDLNISGYIVPDYGSGEGPLKISQYKGEYITVGGDSYYKLFFRIENTGPGYVWIPYQTKKGDQNIVFSGITRASSPSISLGLSAVNDLIITIDKWLDSPEARQIKIGLAFVKLSMGYVDLMSVPEAIPEDLDLSKVPDIYKDELIKCFSRSIEVTEKFAAPSIYPSEANENVIEAIIHLLALQINEDISSQEKIFSYIYLNGTNPPDVLPQLAIPYNLGLGIWLNGDMKAFRYVIGYVQNQNDLLTMSNYGYFPPSYGEKLNSFDKYKEINDIPKQSYGFALTPGMAIIVQIPVGPMINCDCPYGKVDGFINYTEFKIGILEYQYLPTEAQYSQTDSPEDIKNLVPVDMPYSFHGTGPLVSTLSLIYNGNWLGTPVPDHAAYPGTIAEYHSLYREYSEFKDKDKIFFGLFCPVNATFFDKSGGILNNTINSIPGASYIEADLDKNGEIEKYYSMPYNGTTTYQLILTPNSDAKGTFTLDLQLHDIVKHIAKDIPVESIPQSLCNLEIGETDSGDVYVKSDFPWSDNKMSPIASFDIISSLGDVPIKVQFNDTSIRYPTFWKWNFGDGSWWINGTEKNITHIYTRSGTYNVTLIAENSGGPSIATRTISVTRSPVTVSEIKPEIAFIPYPRQIGPFAHPILISGNGFKRNAEVSLSLKGYPEIKARQTWVYNPMHIICDIPLPKNTPPGLWDVIVRNPDGKRGVLPCGYTIITRPVQLARVTGITPETAQNTRPISISSLTGLGFYSGAKVYLTMAGYPDISADSINVDSWKTITCSFNLTGVQPGDWTVVVTNKDGGTGALPRGFTVTGKTV